ncbi:MAG: SseB family protein [Arcanobacterium sp.]|nr:SseB family protein [Arcanobacterium sp.]
MREEEAMPYLESLLKGNPFAGDDGAIDPSLVRAFEAPELMRTESVVEAFEQARVLVGAVPHPHPGRTPDGSVAEHEIAPEPLAQPDGLIRVNFAPERQAYAVFSGVDAYNFFTKKYDISARVRPMPVRAVDAARLAITHGDGLLVLDPSTANQCWIGRSACAALAAGESWVAPWDDDALAEHIMAALPSYLEGFDHVAVDPGENGAAFLTIHMLAGLAQDRVHAIVDAVTEVVASEPYVRARLDVVELRPFWSAD